MKIVSTFDGGRRFKEIPKLYGKVFSSFTEVLEVLKANQNVTLRCGNKGYKNVGKDVNGISWIQRNYVYEY